MRKALPTGVTGFAYRLARLAPPRTVLTGLCAILFYLA